VPLAVTSAKRIAKYPDVKTVAEQGFPGYESVAWWGVFAPAKTPPAIIAAVNVALKKVLSEPAVRDRLIAQGMKLSPPRRMNWPNFWTSKLIAGRRSSKTIKLKPGNKRCKIGCRPLLMLI
jgi:hypothetical protein